MKGSWFDSPSEKLDVRNDVCPSNHDPHSHHTDDRAVRTMLSGLPAFGGFTSYDASLPIDAFTQYLATDTPPPQNIKNESTRTLIRALEAKSEKRGKKRDLQHDTTRDRKRPATELPAVVGKRAKWASLEKERKQACIRVALAAASKYARAGDRVHKLRKVWQENPRRKQMINADVRGALVESVSQWTEKELGTYLNRAGMSGVVTREGMIRAVRYHLAPEREPQTK